MVAFVDYPRTEDAIEWPNRELVVQYLCRSKRVVGPFTVVAKPAVYSGYYIETYVGNNRLSFENTVYSKDPEVIRTVREVAETVDALAVQAANDKIKAEVEHHKGRIEELASTFKAAVRQWNRSK